LYSPGPVACFSDEDDVSGNQNNCYWPLHNESIARCKQWHFYGTERGKKTLSKPVFMCLPKH
jgi:hypothetical protein